MKKGFGKFHTIKINPTSVLINEIIKKKENKEIKKVITYCF